MIIVDGTERYTLQANGDEFVVGKNDRSTPGNAKPKALIQPGTTHTFVVQNPNGQTSLTVTATRSARAVDSLDKARGEIKFRAPCRLSAVALLCERICYSHPANPLEQGAIK